MRQTYVFRIKGGTEFKAADRLLRFGVMPMNPCRYHYVRKHKTGETVLEAEPHLKGYFVGLFPSDRWFEIRNACHQDGTRVLGAPLSPDGYMRPLRADIAATIQDMNYYSAEAPVIEQQRGLKVGQVVILKGGVHAGKRFRLQSVSKSGDKAEAMIEFLGSLRPVTIEAASVDIIEEAA